MSESNVAQDQIKAYVDRILRMKEEAKAINADIREIYAEAKGSGFDKTVLGKLVSYVEKRQTDASAVLESESLFDLYLTAYDGASGRVGTKRATHTHAPERRDPVAALRADPSMHIVDASNLKKKSEPLPTKAAGQAHPETAPFGAATSLPGAEGAEDRETNSGDVAQWTEQGNSTPLVEGSNPSVISTEQQASPQPAVSDLTSPSQAPGQVAPHPVANVEEDADGAIAAASDDPASREVDDADRQQVAASGFSGEGGVGNPDPTTKYAAPGEVIWETHPPEGVERSPISMAFGNMGQDAAVIADDLEKGRAQPIVKKGKVILDGWCRYMTARDMRNLDGSPVAYPVVQYDGSDILVDMIKLNVEGRILTEQQKRLIAANLSRQLPKRKDDIYRAFELWMEPV